MVRGHGLRLLSIALCLVLGCARDEGGTLAMDGPHDAGDETDPSVEMDAGDDSGSRPVAPEPDSGTTSSATFDDCDELASYAREHALELVEASPTGSPYNTPPPVCIACLVIPNPDAFLFAEPRWHHLAGDAGYGSRLAVQGETAFGMYQGSL